MITHTEFAPWREGVFNIPESIYHDHTAAPEVSRSQLVDLLVNTPEHVKCSLDGRRVKKVTKAMQVGTLMDHALLEPDKFKEGVSHWVRPDGLNLATKEGMAWKKDHPGLPYLEATARDSVVKVSAEDIAGMVESVMRHKIGRVIVERGTKQESAFCTDPDTGLLRKCRPDSRLIENSGRQVIGDLKTTFPGGASALAWSSHCARMHYHIQDPFYGDVYKDITGEQPFFIFLVVERKPPYAVRVFQIHDEGRQAGREEYKRALERWAKCKATGVWPSYNEEIEIIQLPKWALFPQEPIVVE